MLARTCFVKSPRHGDGLYPSCKECRNKVRVAWLARQKFCIKCGENERMSGNAYCEPCRRKLEKRPPIPKFRRKKGHNRNFCTRCQIRPPRDNQSYCQPCANAAVREWHWKKKLRQEPILPNQVSKKNRRHYINTLIRRGRVKLGDCYLCGDKATRFHHFDYEPRTRNGIGVCHFCHVLIHRALRKLLTVPQEQV